MPSIICGWEVVFHLYGKKPCWFQSIRKVMRVVMRILACRLGTALENRSLIKKEQAGFQKMEE